MAADQFFQAGYSAVNGLNMYYEIHGQGKPLVLIHGGGSTIETCFGNLIPYFSKTRKVVAMELQAHGHTGDRDTDLSFEQDADDVIALLNNLGIAKADFLGFSNGGHTLIDIALRAPALIDKMIIASAFYSRDAAPEGFWKGFEGATLDMMPQPLQEGYLKANNDKAGLLNMFNKDVKKMKHFTGWQDEQIRSIASPVLIINGNNDVGSVEHAVYMYRMIPGAQLAILPASHGSYIGTVESLENGKFRHSYALDLINGFLSD